MEIMKSIFSILGLLLVLAACQTKVNPKAEAILYDNLIRNFTKSSADFDSLPLCD